ncbi:MAG: PD40 domain-containing protein [Acidobacteria bacterium]|nr:PD40 domain-containing protein [Acidobacteriota bacterium]
MKWVGWGAIVLLLILPAWRQWNAVQASEITVEWIRPQQQGIVIRPLPEAITSLAIVKHVPKGEPNPETETALKVFNDVLWADLKFSALFRLPSPSFFPLQTIRQPEDAKFEDFARPEINAEFITFGNLLASGNDVVLESWLYDVKTRQEISGQRFRFKLPQTRQAAHRIADAVVEKLSAGQSRGVARTRIAFETKRGRAKEIAIMDYDGFNVQLLTGNGSLNLSPAWSPDGRRIVFSSFLSGLPGIDSLEIATGARAAIYAQGSFNHMPAYAPDGNLIAFSSRSERGDIDVFVVDKNGRGRHNITHSPGADFSPTWGPTGRQMAFVSDRAGSPQIYIMDADGSNVRRVVSEEGQAVSPNWSPDGRFIVYAWRPPGRYSYDLFLFNIATSQIFQITSMGSFNENPNWSPDSRHITFESNRTGEAQIFIMNVDGANLRQITQSGVNSNPAWSGYPLQ